MVREHIEDVRLKSLCPLLGEHLWDGYLNYCFLLGFLRHSFNPIILASGSEDTDLQYVNSPTFIFCAALEYLHYEYLKPVGLFMEYLNCICSRRNK